MSAEDAAEIIRGFQGVSDVRIVRSRAGHPALRINIARNGYAFFVSEHPALKSPQASEIDSGDPLSCEGRNIMRQVHPWRRDATIL
jgi:hypothetical protein